MGFDYDFEIDILSAAARDHSYRSRVKKIVRRTDPWSSSSLRDVWELVSKLGDGDKLTGSLVAKFIDDIDDDDEAEDVTAVAREVLLSAPTAPGYAATKLREWTRKHALVGGAAKLIDRLSGDDVEGAEGLIQRLAKENATPGLGVEGGDWFLGFDARQKSRIEERDNPKLSPVIRTRLPTLDVKLKGGLRIGELGLIVGFTNVGKSFFALNFAFVAAASGFTTILVSTEMEKIETDTRLDARYFRRDSSDFYSYNFTKKDLKKFEARRKRTEAILKGRLHTYSTPVNSLTKAGLEDIIDESQDRSGTKMSMIIMDSADHMLPMTHIREKRLQQSAVYWDLKSLLAERKLACWSTCHAPGNFKPLLTEFDQAESKEKGKIASKIITINQTPDEHRKDIVRTFVAKNRNGEKHSTHWVETDYARASIVEIEPPEDEDDED